jgi:hypothetical protein
MLLMISNSDVPTPAVPTPVIIEQQAEKRGSRSDLQPVNAVEALIEQMERFPLVALYLGKIQIRRFL